MNVCVNEKISRLRELMNLYSLDTYIITKFDPHQSEYADEHWNCVKFISSFSGSYGILIVTKNESYLFTDERYSIQAKNELQNTEIKIYSKSNIDFLTFAISKTKKNKTIGFDSKTLSVSQAIFLINKSKSLNININSNIDLLSILWKNRPHIKQNNLINLDIKYAGKSIEEKIKNVRVIMKKYNCNFYIISSLDDIAWLFNIRCISEYNSFNFYAYSIITNTESIIFLNYNKNDNSIINFLKSNNIIVKNYNDIHNYIENLNNKNYKILFSSLKTSYYLYKIFSSKNINLKELSYDITSILKSKKNNIEIKNMKIANIKYGVVLVRLIKWIKENIPKNNFTEFDIEKKLNELKQKDNSYLCSSFKTISAYNENSAIVHYNTKKENSKFIKNNGVLLIDSGANYLEGTTDITRTILFGEISKEIKKYYTLVLKGLISLSKANFLYGTTGGNLDILARLSLYNYCYDYKHGTGHGIGFCLNVHEGPQRISRENNICLEEGMIISNEPGIYLENKFGIRLENTILVKKMNNTNFGKFMKFETLSFIPFEINAIDISLLNLEEKIWLNKYHENTYKKLSPFLNEEEKNWLKHTIRKI